MALGDEHFGQRDQQGHRSRGNSASGGSEGEVGAVGAEGRVGGVSCRGRADGLKTLGFALRDMGALVGA